MKGKITTIQVTAFKTTDGKEFSTAEHAQARQDILDLARLFSDSSLTLSEADCTSLAEELMRTVNEPEGLGSFFGEQQAYEPLPFIDFLKEGQEEAEGDTENANEDTTELESVAALLSDSDEGEDEDLADLDAIRLKFPIGSFVTLKGGHAKYRVHDIPNVDEVLVTGEHKDGYSFRPSSIAKTSIQSF